MKRESVRLRQRFCQVALHPDQDRRLHALSRWVNAQRGRAIIHVDGRPTAVLVTYAEYNQLEKMNTAQIKQRLLAQLQDIRARQSGQPARS